MIEWCVTSLSTIMGLALSILGLVGAYWYQSRAKREGKAKLEIRLQRSDDLRKELQNF